MTLLGLAASLTTPAYATAPRPFGEGEFRQAALRGAAAVRVEFHRRAFKLLRTAETSAGLPPRAGFESHTSALSHLGAWCPWWIDAETYQILKDGAPADDFEHEVWDPLFLLWTQLSLSTDQLNEEVIEADLPPYLRDRYPQNTKSSLKSSVFKADTELPYRLALLAAVADRPDLVHQVLQANGGVIREPDRRFPAQIQGRVATSASEFMELDRSAETERLKQLADAVLHPRPLPVPIAPRPWWREMLERWLINLAFIGMLIGIPFGYWFIAAYRQSAYP